MGKSFLANIPPPTCKNSGLELAWPKMPALWATWRPGKLTGKQAAGLAIGKALPQKENLDRELRSCWDSGQRGTVVSGKLPDF
jgi:hypothetical protein